MSDENLEILEIEPDELEPLIDQEEDYIHGRVLLGWTGPSDLPDDENRRWFIFVMTFSIVLILFSLLINRVLLALILAGVCWLSLMLRKLPSQDIDYTITTTGIFIDDKFYPWSELNGFWIIKDHGHYVLGVDTNKRFFSSLMILLGEQNPLVVKDVISRYLPFNEDKNQDFINTWVEKSSTWLEQFIDKALGKFQQARAKKEDKPTDKES